MNISGILSVKWIVLCLGCSDKCRSNYLLKFLKGKIGSVFNNFMGTVNDVFNQEGRFTFRHK